MFVLSEVCSRSSSRLESFNMHGFIKIVRTKLLDPILSFTPPILLVLPVFPYENEHVYINLVIVFAAMALLADASGLPNPRIELGVRLLQPKLRCRFNHA